MGKIYKIGLKELLEKGIDRVLLIRTGDLRIVTVFLGWSYVKKSVSVILKQRVIQSIIVISNPIKCR